MSWEEGTKFWAEQTGPDDGFYLSLQVSVPQPLQLSQMKS